MRTLIRCTRNLLTNSQLLSFIVLIFTFGVHTHSLASPVTVVPMESVLESSILQGRVLDFENRWVINKSPLWSQQGQNIYLIQLPGFTGQGMVQSLSAYGKVWHFQEGEFAIMGIDNPELRSELSSALHRVGGTCGAMRFLDGSPIGEFRLPTAQPIVTGLENTHYEEYKKIVDQVNITNIQKSIREMESWETRYHSHPEGQMAGHKVAALYQMITPLERSDVTINLYDHKNTPQKSVIVRIPGTSRPDEVIIFGSHLDSINKSTRNEFAPGADDNASGTATNLEIFRLMMANNLRPQRTIEIHAYAAEEIGLVGSNEIAREYRRNEVNVVAMIQHDMTAYSGEVVTQLFFVSNKTDAELTAQLGSMVDRYIGIPWTTRPLYFGSSDHASWNRQGYAAAFPFENPRAHNRAIHTSDDVFERLNAWDQATAFAKVGIAYILHFGGF